MRQKEVQLILRDNYEQPNNNKQIMKYILKTKTRGFETPKYHGAKLFKNASWNK